MSRRAPLAGLVAVLLLAFGLRALRLGAQSLWYDETVSAFLAAERAPALVAHTARDIHPPGYYLLLHAWTRLAGTSEFALAFLSLGFGLLLAALAYRLGARVFGRGAGLLAAVWVAISPYHIWYSQEVRMYTLGAVLGTGALLATLAALEGRPSWRSLAGYALCAGLGLWVLYYFGFLLAALNGMVLAVWAVRARRSAPHKLRARRSAGWGWLGRWALAQAGGLLLFAPWLPAAWRQVAHPPVPPWRGFTGPGEVLVQVWTALSLGQSAPPGSAWPVLLGVAALVGLGLATRARGRGRPLWPAWLLAGAALLPVALIEAASLLTPLYHVRYAFPYSLPFYVVGAAGLDRLRRRARPAAAAALAVLALFSGLSLRAAHTDYQYAADDHRAAARFLAERLRPGDAVLANAGYVYTALLSYWEGDRFAWRGRLTEWQGQGEGGPVLLQTGSVDGEAALGFGDPAADFYAMPLAEAEAALARAFAAYDRVWVYRCYDTVTDPRGDLRRWLAAHGTPFEEQGFSGEAQLRVQGYLTGRDPLAGSPARLDLELADGSLRLLAAAPPAAAVDTAVDTALVWQVGAPLADERILFAGLFDEGGQRWAQADERPLGSLLPVGAWAEGAVVRTPLRVRLPAGVPPGRYRLEVGWYRFVDAQPVWIPLEAGERLLLGWVEVGAPAEPLPLPVVAQRLGVRAGEGLELAGVSAAPLRLRPGESLQVELLWVGTTGERAPGPAVVQLLDAEGRAVAESSAEPPGPLAEGQAAWDRRSLQVPAGLPAQDGRPGVAGVYRLALARRGADGNWLALRRGPFQLGSHLPLATVWVEGGR